MSEVGVFARELADWCRRKATFYERTKSDPGCEDPRWCQGRLESFLETADTLDAGWPFALDAGDGAVPRGSWRRRK